MKLAELLAGIVPVPAGPLGEIGIGGISVDSRSVRPGDLFVAVSGARADGHAYLADAARGGAAAALVERELSSPPLPVVRVPSTTAALPG
ncbi:MAG TPA: Mur ligase domain-containing protein, partial [Candidatus Deferrimicrobium sp.]|nr:Mur ligase domain-containing protein [Candidatus Deferrimicrobium sp.]